MQLLPEAPGHHFLRWEDSADRATAYLGEHAVGTVEWDGTYSTSSWDGSLHGHHSSADAARNEVEGWFRWVRHLEDDLDPDPETHG
jgi:hypothetical protein